MLQIIAKVSAGVVVLKGSLLSLSLSNKVMLALLVVIQLHDLVQIPLQSVSFFLQSREIVFENRLLSPVNNMVEDILCDYRIFEMLGVQRDHVLLIISHERGKMLECVFVLFRNLFRTFIPL